MNDATDALTGALTKLVYAVEHPEDPTMDELLALVATEGIKSLTAEEARLVRSRLQHDPVSALMIAELDSVLNNREQGEHAGTRASEQTHATNQPIRFAAQSQTDRVVSLTAAAACFAGAAFVGVRALSDSSVGSSVDAIAFSKPDSADSSQAPGTNEQSPSTVQDVGSDPNRTQEDFGDLFVLAVLLVLAILLSARGLWRRF